jgi:hypothetical protein
MTGSIDWNPSQATLIWSAGYPVLAYRSVENGCIEENAAYAAAGLQWRGALTSGNWWALSGSGVTLTVPQANLADCLGA